MLNWAIKKFNIPEDATIIRPFYPGGDYEHEDYPDGCVVIDNPPFSIFKDIVKFYSEHNIRYVPFCPGLVISKEVIEAGGLCVIDYTITYENGAQVSTSFAHNFYHAIESEPELYESIARLQRKKLGVTRHHYQDNVIYATKLEKLSRRGYHVKIKTYEYMGKHLDAQTQYYKNRKKRRFCVYGSYVLVSDKQAAEIRRMLDDSEINGKEIYNWNLSERERAIIEKLNKEETGE